MSSGLRMTDRRGQRWLDGFAVTASVVLAVAHVGNWRVLSHGTGARPTCPVEEEA